MTENEAKIFIQNAMEQSKKALAELLLISPKVFAVRKKSLGEYYSNLENCKKEIQSCEVAIKALEEVQRWHTSVINPNIKNEFANTSTQICHNCDHKDEYIEELEAEVEPYRALEKRLTDMFGGELSLEDIIDELERQLKEPGSPHPVNAKILTYEDAADWDAYRAIGTPEELQDMKNNYFEALSDWRQYRKIGTLEECRTAVEKQKAKKPRPIDYKKYIGIVKNAEYLRGAYWCLNCNQAIKSGTFCKNCGQKLDWSDEE
nr:MAG TPA: putative tRNA pseudouridine synthase B [Caudoviricetes sp.]